MGLFLKPVPEDLSFPVSKLGSIDHTHFTPRAWSSAWRTVGPQRMSVILILIPHGASPAMQWLRHRLPLHRVQA